MKTYRVKKDFCLAEKSSGFLKDKYFFVPLNSVIYQKGNQISISGLSENLVVELLKNDFIEVL